MKIQASHQVTLYGINYKDTDKAASDYLTAHGDPYALLGADHTGRVAIDWGVYGTPETFLIDKTGTIRYKHIGPMTEVVWNNEFLPKIKRLKQ